MHALLRRLLLISSGLLLAANAAGCSSSPISVRRNVELALTEYRIDPQTVDARAGQVTILVRNHGRRTHNLVLSRGSLRVGSTSPLWPGQSAQLTLTLTPGKYLMASSILSDQALGEYGSLVVH